MSSPYLLSRYPNGTQLVRLEADQWGNDQQLRYKNDIPIVETYLSGVVYINQTTFEVYQNINNERRTGLYIIGHGFDWSVETPRQKYDKAYKALKMALSNALEQLSSSCLCAYPRIIDYILTRQSIEQGLLQSYLIQNYLIQLEATYDVKTEVETTIFKCKNCTAQYKRQYRERAMDGLQLWKESTIKPIGKPIKKIAPNYLTAYFDEVFCRKSYIHRQNLVQSDLETTLNYLFERI